MAHTRGLCDDEIENELNNSDFENSGSEDEDGDIVMPENMSSSFDSETESSEEDEDYQPQRLPFRRGRLCGRTRTAQGRRGVNRPNRVDNSVNMNKWSENNFEVRNTDLMEPSYLPIDTSDFEKFDYFTLYIDAEVIESIVTKTNQTAIKLTGRSLNLTTKECNVYIGATFVMSTIGYPKLRMYWEQKWRIAIIANNLSRNRFLALRKSFKVVFDDDVSPEDRSKDKLWKVRPLLERVVHGCRKQKKDKEISIDEMIIPFTGSCGIKQYCPGKPNPTGLKAFVLANPDGIVCDLFIYQGLTTFANGDLDSFTLGEKSVLTLTQSLVPGHVVYCDRYFTTEKLIDTLYSQGIYCTGTVMKNRIPKEARPHLKSDRELKNAGRGSSQVVVRDDSNMALTRWMDNKPVTLLSSVQAKVPEDYCERWCKIEKKFISVQRPNVVRAYNSNMGGVDLADRMLAVCPNRYRTRKWTQRFVSHMFDLAVNNCWIQYKNSKILQNVPKHKIQQLRSYKLELGEYLIESNVFVQESDPEDENIPENQLLLEIS